MTGEAEGSGGDRVCESCATEEDDLVAVHRMYVVPASWDTPGSATTLDDIELWCFPCRSMYPHAVAEPS